jgi:RNA polymerase sigma factor (sigma-70 family)
MLERRTRPPRGEIDEAAIALLARHGAQILATARRYAANADDADDAYQRGLEILLTKAPTTREDELVPWLKTVVKHEAFALRRQRDRLTPVSGDGEPHERATAPAATHEQAERYERLRQGAEALGRLKPQEIRCLVLKAQGLSYREICDVTGFTYTKVNRCLTEGRQALSVQLAGIEDGVECNRLAPLLSALADGEATAEQLAVLRPHMKSCLACRARLREFRAAPARVAALAPAGLLPTAGPTPGRLEAVVDTALRKAESVVAAAQHKAEALLGAAQHKTTAVGERAYAAAELVSAQKVAAVAASAAALAGGGVAVDQFANHQGPPRPTAARQAPPSATEQTATTPTSPAPPAVTTEQTPTAEQPPPPAPQPEAPPPPPPDPANEFAPASASAAPTPTARPPSRTTRAPPAAPTPPATRPAPPASGGQSEFTP